MYGADQAPIDALQRLADLPRLLCLTRFLRFLSGRLGSGMLMVFSL